MRPAASSAPRSIPARAAAEAQLREALHAGYAVPAPACAPVDLAGLHFDHLERQIIHQLLGAPFSADAFVGPTGYRWSLRLRVSASSMLVALSSEEIGRCCATRSTFGEEALPGNALERDFGDRLRSVGSSARASRVQVQRGRRERRAPLSRPPLRPAPARPARHHAG